MSASELDKAIERNDLSEVQRLVQAGADLNHMGDYDATPLANAAALGHLAIVEYLLKSGADPNNGGCRVMLHVPCGRGHTEVCRLLLDAGADPNEQDEDGGDTIGMAIFKARLEVLKLLIERGADVNDLNDRIEHARSMNQSGSHDQVIKYLSTLTG